MATVSSGQDDPGDDPEEREPGLARERTSLAWTRTAVSFAALGGAVLKENVITGLIILAIAPVVWHLGRVSRGRAIQDSPTRDGAARDGAARDGAARDGAARERSARDGAIRDGAARDRAAGRADLPAAGATRLFVIAAAIVAVSVLCLLIAIFGQSVPGALR